MQTTKPTDVPVTTRPAEAASLASAPRSIPIERRLPLLILGLLAFVLAISLFVSYYEIKLSAEASARDRLTSLSQVIGSLMQTQIGGRATTMRRIATDSSVVNAFRTPTRSPSPAAMTAMSALVTRADSLTPVRLLTADGQPVGEMHLHTPADDERFRTELRALASSPDSLHIGNWYTENGHASFWMAAPVHQNGQLLGYVVQERRLVSNSRGLQPFRDLIGADIDMYFRNRSDNTWVELTSGAAPPPAQIGPDSVTVFTHGKRGEVLAATAPVRGTPFLITVEYPMAQLLARPKATMRALVVIAMLLAVFGALIAWLIGRRLTRPLVELTGAAEAMAEGQYAQRVRAGGSDEIGRLGVAFNRMAEQVQVSSIASDEAVVRLTYSAATQEFLAEASRILAESLSDETLLADLARYCVPTLSDYASIYVVDDDGSIRRVETAHYDAAKQDAVRELVARYAPRLDEPGQVSDVIRSQKPLFIARLDPAAVRASAPDAETAELLDVIGPTAFLCVPLIARGRSLGAIALTMTDSGRTFAQDDLELSLELARRTAVAIDNSFIYKRSLQLRLEAEAASSAKSDFLAKMSHEIRTPINAMMGYAELLEMGISGPVSDAQARQLSRIRASGEHLTSLVNEILDLAKIEAGRMAVDPTVGITGEAVDAALGLIRPQALAKNVQIINRVNGDGAVHYLGDPQRVQQILTNLLSNAVKFTPTGGTVVIRSGTGKRQTLGDSDPSLDWTRIVVQDTGIGIGAEDLERIFQPFVQVENGYTRAHGGTGLGLTISRSLAQMMGGGLDVESSIGGGSQFTLWLPSPTSSVIES